jgi:hypothetical protein
VRRDRLEALLERHGPQEPRPLDLEARLGRDPRRVLKHSLQVTVAAGRIDDGAAHVLVLLSRRLSAVSRATGCLLVFLLTADL